MDGKLMLDTNNPITLTISNDAYYYFFEGEDPLDESSLDEIAEISASFENGFEPDENEPPMINVSNGTVTITLIPYAEQCIELKKEQSASAEQDMLEFDESLWDGVINEGGLFPWMFYFKFIGKNRVKIAQINIHFSKRLNDCEGDITWINNKPWIKYKTKPEHKGYSLMPMRTPRTTIFDNKNVAEFMSQN